MLFSNRARSKDYPMTNPALADPILGVPVKLFIDWVVEKHPEVIDSEYNLARLRKETFNNDYFYLGDAAAYGDSKFAETASTRPLTAKAIKMFGNMLALVGIKLNEVHGFAVDWENDYDGPPLVNFVEQTEEQKRAFIRLLDMRAAEIAAQPAPKKPAGKAPPPTPPVVGG